MTWDEHENLAIYKVVINHEQGKSGTKTQCLAHIRAVWIDMRRLSVRQWREQPSGEE